MKWPGIIIQWVCAKIKPVTHQKMTILLGNHWFWGYDYFGTYPNVIISLIIIFVPVCYSLQCSFQANPWEVLAGYTICRVQLQGLDRGQAMTKNLGIAAKAMQVRFFSAGWALMLVADVGSWFRSRWLPLAIAKLGEKYRSLRLTI